MNIEDKLCRLIEYLNFTKYVGHTTTMLEGAKNTDCIILVHNERFGQELKAKCNMYKKSFNPFTRFFQNLFPKKFVFLNTISIDSLDYKLYGLRKPLAIDNATLYIILCEALKEINRLKKN